MYFFTKTQNWNWGKQNARDQENGSSTAFEALACLKAFSSFYLWQGMWLSPVIPYGPAILTHSQPSWLDNPILKDTRGTSSPASSIEILCGVTWESPPDLSSAQQCYCKPRLTMWRQHIVFVTISWLLPQECNSFAVLFWNYNQCFQAPFF